MPVPVPRLTKPLSHPVQKSKSLVPYHTAPTLNAAGAQPVTSFGPSLSFRSDDWNNTLPSWRRSKQRPHPDENVCPALPIRVQDFYQGLTAADNASVIKGAHAEACIPPVYNPVQAPHPPATGTYLQDSQRMDDMVIATADQTQLDKNMRWGVDFLVGREGVDLMGEDTARHHYDTNSSPLEDPTNAATNHSIYQAGTFSPIFEDQSPGSGSGPDNGSSPFEPITPFGDFVDRAVANAQSYAALHSHAESTTVEDYYQDRQVNLESYQAPPVFPTLTEQPKEEGPIPDTVPPSANVGYKKLSEPLSEWVAGYVWKVCTSGFSLPPAFAQPSMTVGPYAVMPPSYLAPAIHSLLLSTLLQPSAVILAMWYIVRLPVFFGAASLSTEFGKEKSFRDALFGEGYAGVDNDNLEGGATFRLVVLGCMLANKWLDDHTFSNKTWHSISNVPIQTLNKLEALTLDIFSFDLSISSPQWSQWLDHVMSYHISLTSPTYPQPISRPSSNPHSIVRRAIDEIIQVPSTRASVSSLPQPVFLGLEDRIRERLEKEAAMDVLEIDLDADGPLREEYLPKRRASKLGSHSTQLHHNFDLGQGHSNDAGNWVGNDSSVKHLPPPAKWSPAGDEPILRDRNRVSGQYVAVQAPPIHMAPYPTSYHPHDTAYSNNQNWNPALGYMPVKSQSGYMYDPTGVYRLSQLAYNPFGHGAPMAIPHVRSQSLSYDQDNSRNHMRSYSQSRFEYKHSDLRTMANEHVPFKDTATKWMEQATGYVCPSQAYIHIPAVGFQPPW